ncbi:MAG: hypothetical protein AB3N16_07955 [Flavobacteriaceae bacterium]
MKQEKVITVGGTTYWAVTPAQKELLELLRHNNAERHYQALKNVHHLATYFSDKDLMVLWQHGFVQDLLDAIGNIKTEHFIHTLKEA